MSVRQLLFPFASFVFHLAGFGHYATNDTSNPAIEADSVQEREAPAHTENRIAQSMM